MATNTYVALNKITVTTATPSITFTNISGAYTDLILVANVGTSTAGPITYQVGNTTVDTGSNYSRTCLYGDGSSGLSFRESNQTYFNTANGGTSLTAIDILHFMNYSNTTTFKTILNRNGRADSTVQANVYLWRSTSAINTIKVFNANGYNLIAGSTFSLYGIAAASVGAKATGGIIYSDSNYFYHAFSSSGSFVPSQSLSADVLVVAGGGGGGSAAGGGGGAGGLLIQSGRSCSSGTSYTVTIGAGGAGSTGDGGSGSNGVNSIFDTITAIGGGGGSHVSTGANGGSGGGAGYGSGSGGSSIQSNSGGATGYGFAGGNQTRTGSGVPYPSAGGGGAGGVGGNAIESAGGVGGIGRTDAFINSIGFATGLGELVSGNTYFAGGGGGSRDGSLATGGYGGGGRGGTVLSGGASMAPIAGKANTGGGGGGGIASGTYNQGGNVGVPGGSGIVIVRYAK